MRVVFVIIVQTAHAIFKNDKFDYISNLHVAKEYKTQTRKIFKVYCEQALISFI